MFNSTSCTQVGTAPNIQDVDAIKSLQLCSTILNKPQILKTEYFSNAIFPKEKASTCMLLIQRQSNIETAWTINKTSLQQG